MATGLKLIPASKLKRAWCVAAILVSFVWANDGHAQPWAKFFRFFREEPRFLPSKKPVVQPEGQARPKFRLNEIEGRNSSVARDDSGLQEVLTRIPEEFQAEARRVCEEFKSKGEPVEGAVNSFPKRIRQELLVRRDWPSELVVDLNDIELDVALELEIANPRLGDLLRELPNERRVFEGRKIIVEQASHNPSLAKPSASLTLQEASLARLKQVSEVLPKLNAVKPVRHGAVDSYGLSQILELAPGAPATNRPSLVILDKFDTSTPRERGVTVFRAGRADVHQLKKSPLDFLNSEQRWLGNGIKDSIGKHGAADPILVVGDTGRFTTSGLFPGQISAKTFDGSVAFLGMHIENFNSLLSRNLSKNKLRVFNEIPTSDSVIGDLRLKGTPSQWGKVHGRYQGILKEHDIAANAGGDKSKILKTLKEAEEDLILMLAHGDSKSISLADGSRVTVEDIVGIPSYSGSRKPIVILFVCDAGAPIAGGAKTIAQTLLTRGRAAAVLAPTERIPAGGSTLSFFKALLEAAERQESVAEALRVIHQRWQLYVDIAPVRLRGKRPEDDRFANFEALNGSNQTASIFYSQSVA